MAIFYSYVSLPEGKHHVGKQIHQFTANMSLGLGPWALLSVAKGSFAAS